MCWFLPCRLALARWKLAMGLSIVGNVLCGPLSRNTRRRSPSRRIELITLGPVMRLPWDLLVHQVHPNVGYAATVTRSVEQASAHSE